MSNIINGSRYLPAPLEQVRETFCELPVLPHQNGTNKICIVIGKLPPSRYSNSCGFDCTDKHVTVSC